MNTSQRGGAVKAASQGFTLLELMITVAILALLVGIGVPSFNAMLRQNRLATQTNELVAATALARSEAVKRGSLVTLCPANLEGDDCSGSDDWTQEWIVFPDLDGDGSAQPDQIVQRWPGAATRGVGITSAGLNFISYRGDGSSSIAPGGQVTYLLWSEPCTADLGARQLRINAAGRTSVVRVECP